MPIRTIETDTTSALPTSLKDLKLSASPTPETILSQLTLPQKVFLLSGTSFTRTSSLPTHNLHPVKTSDGPTDIRGEGVFNAPRSLVVPNASCLASTWDPALIERVGSALAYEAKLKTVDILLAPNLNLHRDPRGGRNQESYGEDGFLAGKCGAAFIRGIQENGIPACAKHLVCNDSETERRFYDVQVDEKTLREVYLKPFQIAVEESKPVSIMTAYNKINGKSAAQNAHVMDVVRDMGFEGLYMSDWFGTYDGVESVKAGLDLEMPFPAARGPNLLKAVQEGTLSESEIDARALKVIQFLSDLSAPVDSTRGPDQPSDNLSSNVAIARQAAADGIILLQNNDSILPLDPKSGKSIGIIGSLATDRIITQLICASYLVTPLDGIKSAYPNDKILHAHGLQTHKVVPKLDSRYTKSIAFHKWNKGARSDPAAKPIHTDVYPEALEAIFMRHIPGLAKEFEIEMIADVTVPKTGQFILSLISCYDAKVYINDELVYTYTPSGVVDIQKFLFHSHQIVQTFPHTFTSEQTYKLQIIVSSQPQSGPEPVAQGLIFGMVEDLTREETIAEAVEVAKKVDTAIVFVGTTSEWEMEGMDREDITLPCGQDELIKAVLEVNQNVVVVNQSGAAVDLREASGAKAVVHAHVAGQEAGNAIADVLFGRVNPGGKATYTWPRDLKDVPTYGQFPCKEDLSLPYPEGVFGGYKGYLKSGKAPIFPFGHGLSYTRFAYTDSKSEVTSSGDIEVSVKISNTGTTAGREVVQVYLSGPAVSKYSSPLRVLGGFAKSGLIQAGGDEIVKIKVQERELKVWDIEADQWVLEKGRYTLHVAKSVEDVVEVLEVDL